MNLTNFNKLKFTIKALLAVPFFPSKHNKIFNHFNSTSTLSKQTTKTKRFMLFCLLHPMDHNTGPLARKSTTLCALLLVSIAALLVFAVPGQATVEEVGVAKHTKDGNSVTLNPVSKPAGTNLKYAEYKKRFGKVCNFLITDDNIELLYEGRGCTVELITDERSMINFTTGIKNSKCENLQLCGSRDFQDGFSNLLPFAYSRSNVDLEKLNKGPLYVDENVCKGKNQCGKDKCMKHTFLEVSWSRCIKDQFIYIYAHTHLIGEHKTGLDQKNQGGSEMKFKLGIASDSSFTMDFERPATFDTKIESISCLPRENAIARPEKWKIKNRDLEGKHLLVFHLLPQTASVKYSNNEYIGQLKSGKPSCDLFISFKKGPYEFLQVDPPTTTTSTTTTAPKPKPGTSPPLSPPLPPGKTNPTPAPQKVNGTTTNVQGVQGTEGGSNAWIWIVVAIFAVIAVIGLYVAGSCCYRKHQKQKKEEKEEQLEKIYWDNAGNDTEIAEQNIKRSVSDKPSLEKEFVKDIFERMKKENTDNALKIEKILYKLYLPALEDKGFEAIGTFREWRKKNDMFKGEDETLGEFNGRVEKAIAKRDETERTSEYFNKQQEKEYFESNAKPTEGKKKKKKGGKKKKDSAPDKSETSDVPTDLLSDPKEKKKKKVYW
uniref:Uncharacterized protein n=1 Tax=Meloidogyne incognita TaxID=6306 RepID=A0A914MKF6_MELIC